MRQTFTICRFAGLDEGREIYGPWHSIALYDGMKATAAAWNIVFPGLHARVERR